jgi:hypothetical protein
MRSTKEVSAWAFNIQLTETGVRGGAVLDLADRFELVALERIAAHSADQVLEIALVLIAAAIPDVDQLLGALL